MVTLRDLQTALQTLANPSKRLALQRFFKTEKGEYAEGDVFLGITVPEQRKLIKQFLTLPLKDIEKLLQNNIHEYRFCALLLLIHHYQKGNNQTKAKVLEIYVRSSSQWINNWDLVDISAPPIMGDFVFNSGAGILLKRFSESGSLWQRRIAIVSTLYFIRRGEFQPTLKVCEQLLLDQHDLIHKSCGWMLREVGKRNEMILLDFLETHHQIMPRTMLRYAIEKLSPDQKKHFFKSTTTK